MAHWCNCDRNASKVITKIENQAHFQQPALLPLWVQVEESKSDFDWIESTSCKESKFSSQIDDYEANLLFSFILAMSHVEILIEDLRISLSLSQLS